MGLLPVIAADLHVSIPTAGLLVTGYAWAWWSGAFADPADRARAAQMAPTRAYGAIHAGQPALRLVTQHRAAGCAGGDLALPRRLFGVGSVVVAPAQHASAVAGMFMGLTIANIGGVPLATWVGQHLGWRVAFAGIAGLGVIAILAIQLALPKLAAGPPSNVGQELGVMRRPAVLLALATTVLGSGAMFTVFTYIAPILQSEAQVSESVITLALVVYGVGLTIGNWLGGHLRGSRAAPHARRRACRTHGAARAVRLHDAIACASGRDRLRGASPPLRSSPRSKRGS